VVTVHLENQGAAEHNFSISSEKISKNLQSGGTADVKVTFPKSGVLPFFCQFHTTLGMNGGLKVSG
jgi:plastocyanin